MNKYLLVVALILAAFFAGKFSAPAKVTVDHKVDTVKDQIILELNRQLAFKSVQTDSVTTSVTSKDGTIKTVTRVRTKSISIESVIDQTKDTVHEAKKEDTKTVTENTRGVVVGPMLTFTTSDPAHPIFSGVLDAPIFGPLHIFGNVMAGPSIGIGIGIGGGFEF